MKINDLPHTKPQSIKRNNRILAPSFRSSPVKGHDSSRAPISRNGELPVKDQILENASKLFARFGLGKTTTSDIASSLHMGKSSLYHYFRSKEDIFKEVLNFELNKLKANISKSMRNSKSPEERLENFIIARMKFFKENENLSNAIKDEYLSYYDFVNEARRYFDQIEMHWVKQILREGIRTGVFAVEDVLSASQTIIAAIRGFGDKFKTKEKITKKSIERMLSVIINGISKH